MQADAWKLYLDSIILYTRLITNKKAEKVKKKSKKKFLLFLRFLIISYKSDVFDVKGAIDDKMVKG